MKKNLKARQRSTALSLLFFPILLILFVSGCAHVISEDIRKNSDLSLTLNQFRGNPSTYIGKSVVWGGEIIQVINQEDGTTEIEVFQEPLDFTGEPKERGVSEGRFLVLSDGFLDPYVYRTGRRITVAGELREEKIEPLGEIYYRYPLITSKQIYLWPVYYPYPYYAYDPWWYDDFWWGYPYGWWGLGFFFHHHHHHHHPGKGSSPSWGGRPGFHRGVFGSRGFSGGRGGASLGGGVGGHR